MTYSILDEPKPSPISHLTVDPLWPLLAVMFGGPWLSWPWFVLNGHAIGSPTRHREAALAVGGLIGSVLILLGIGAAGSAGLISDVAIQYLLVLLTVWQLGVSYWLYISQARPFGLWQHFGGQSRNGLLVVLAGTLLELRVLTALPQFWQMILR